MLRLVVTKMGLTDKTLSETLPSGWPRFDNQVAWARFYLVKAGVIDASRRGVWTLTEKGRQLGQLTHEDALRLFKEVHARFQGIEKASCPGENEETTAAPPEGGLLSSAGNFRQAVLERLRHLPASGFERFAQRLLRESDFEEVTITGRSGDGGIDGVGVLQVKAFTVDEAFFKEFDA